MPLLHDHLLLSVKGQRLDGRWAPVHTLALHEYTVAAFAFYNELVAAEVCEALGAGDRAAHRHSGAPACEGDCRGAARADPLDLPTQRPDCRLPG